MNRRNESIMFGWRAKLGLIMPSNNTVIEPELSMALPRGVTIHGHRVGVKPEERGEDFMEVLRKDAVENGFKMGPVDCIAYCCLTTSFYHGIGWDQELLDEMRKNTGKPVTTAATAMLRSLEKMEVEKVSIATPFRKDVNVKLVEFLEGNGFKIAGMNAIDPAPSPQEVILLPSTVAYRLAKTAVKPDSDCVFICSTDLPSLEIIDALEKDIKKPVISTNQALLWDMLRMIDIKTAIDGFGALLRI